MKITLAIALAMITVSCDNAQQPTQDPVIQEDIKDRLEGCGNTDPDGDCL